MGFLLGTPGRALRGGSWNNNDNNVRSSNRNRNTPDNINNNIGFRCARLFLSTLRPECAAFTDTARAPWRQVLAIPALVSAGANTK
ncbi:MAG: SUMF1/EgtB/PvdO family nonheme iron enzyme [Chloroflexota bacterium]